MPALIEASGTTATRCCEENARKCFATAEQPYHYVGSGLQSVYLIGVTYYVCRECNKQAAEIPSMKELHEAIARAVVSKTSPINGDEVRFLRKRLGIKAVDFSPMVSLTPEYLSAVENSPDPVDPGRDKLVRLIYRAMSGDKSLKEVFSKQHDFQRWITSINKSGLGERIIATRTHNNHWKVEAAAA
jgi:DNA-binding transcriptional regulator YiaG